MVARWSVEPASRDDVRHLDTKIDQVEQRLDAKIEIVRVELATRIDSSEHRVIAAMRGELNAQVRSMLFGFVGLQIAIGSFVIGLLRFGV